jgi:aspartate aminotransferase
MAAYQNYLRQVKKSGTLVANELIQKRRQQNLPTFAFGFGQSPFPPTQRAIDALQKNAFQKYYAPVQGIAQLREAVAAFHEAAEGLKTSPARILIADGSKNLLFTAMQAFSKADILIPVPAWVSYAPQAAILGHHAIPVPTSFAGNWRVTPEALERALMHRSGRDIPAMLILNHPGNPDGLGYSLDQMRALAEVLRRHNVIVLSDEIYGLLHHKGEHRSLASAYPEGTIVTGGLSKWCGAGGWRLGMAILPETLEGAFKDTMLAIASETYSCAPTPIQHAACEAYIWDGVTQDYLAHQRRILSLAGNWLANRLGQAGIGVHRPEGGFYLFLDFSAHADALRRAGIVSSQQLCEDLLRDTGVSVLYGDVFGMQPNQLSARLAYVDFDGAAALAASEAIGLERPLDESFLLQHLGGIYKGAEQLCVWLAIMSSARLLRAAG